MSPLEHLVREAFAHRQNADLLNAWQVHPGLRRGIVMWVTDFISSDRQQLPEHQRMVGNGDRAITGVIAKLVHERTAKRGKIGT